MTGAVRRCDGDDGDDDGSARVVSRQCDRTTVDGDGRQAMMMEDGATVRDGDG